jgi:hypothetical protein
MLPRMNSQSSGLFFVILMRRSAALDYQMPDSSDSAVPNIRRPQQCQQRQQYQQYACASALSAMAWMHMQERDQDTIISKQ